MKEIQTQTFPELHEVITTDDERSIIYCGMKSIKFPLIPKNAQYPVRLMEG